MILWYCDNLRTDKKVYKYPCPSVISQTLQYHKLKSFPSKVQNSCSIGPYLQTTIFSGVVLWYCDNLRAGARTYWVSPVSNTITWQAHANPLCGAPALAPAIDAPQRPTPIRCWCSSCWWPRLHSHGWIIVQSVQSIWRRGHHCIRWQALVWNLSTLLSSKLMY